MSRFPLILALVLASCSGRCTARVAVQDEVPSGRCVVDRDSNDAICIDGTTVIRCAVVGVGGGYEARSHVLGRLVTAAEAP